MLGWIPSVVVISSCLLGASMMRSEALNRYFDSSLIYATPLPLYFKTSFLAPLAVREGRNFAGLYLAATAPKDIRVTYVDARLLEVFVNGGFVGEEHRFVRAVGDSHDVDVVKLGAALAPIGVRHDVVPTHFTARLDFTTGRHSPVKEGVISCHRLAVHDRLYVFQKCREAADDLPTVQAFRDFQKRVQRHRCLPGPGGPDVGDEFFRCKFTFQRHEDPPLFVVERRD